jgi:hypothetical protein
MKPRRRQRTTTTTTTEDDRGRRAMTTTKEDAARRFVEVLYEHVCAKNGTYAGGVCVCVCGFDAMRSDAIEWTGMARHGTAWHGMESNVGCARTETER